MNDLCVWDDLIIISVKCNQSTIIYEKESGINFGVRNFFYICIFMVRHDLKYVAMSLVSHFDHKTRIDS